MEVGGGGAVRSVRAVTPFVFSEGAEAARSFQIRQMSR